MENIKTKLYETEVREATYKNDLYKIRTKMLDIS